MKKNVVVILCDQLRVDHLSCYNESSAVKTKNIDSLAEGGVLFKHAVTASPVCAPSRASVMTGRYVSDHGVWTNDIAFRDGMELLPQRMKENGYSCGAFGKLHHYPARDSKGFDYAWQMEENRLAEEDDYYKYLHEIHPEVQDSFGLKDGGFPYSPEEYYEAQIAKRAVRYIESVKDKNFFTWVSFQGPHTPIDPPQTDYAVDTNMVKEPHNRDFIPPCEVTKYRRSRAKVEDIGYEMEYRKGYAQLVEFIDNQVGRIISYLKDNGLYENTMIIFSTDHGDMCGDYNMHQKGPYIYSAQFEVPLIITNNDRLPKNVASDILTGNLDIASTVLAACGDDRALAYSRDIAKMYNDAGYARREMFSEFSDSMKVISTKEYRFAYFPFTGECELFLLTDETNNLADLPEYQEMKLKFMADIIDYMVVAKGAKIEAWDNTPKVQKGLNEKFSSWQDDMEICLPIPSMQEIESLKADGLDATYNEFCKEKYVSRHYGLYWDETIASKNG